MLSNVFNIAAKEIRVGVSTPVIYVLSAAYVLLSAFFFERLLVQFQALSLSYRERSELVEALNLTDFVMTPLFFWMATFLLLILPLLTMRLFAEERRNKTLELLFTVPVSVSELVVGKFVGAWVLMAVMVSLTVLFPWILMGFGSSSSGVVLDLSTVASGYLGVLLIGTAFIAVGMVASSAADSQLVAALLALTVSIALLTAGLAAPGLTGLWRDVVVAISFAHHITEFGRGLIRISTIVYYVTLTGFALFVCVRFVDGQRYR